MVPILPQPPQTVAEVTVAEKLAAAGGYVTLGWYLFVLGPNKKPLANCDACRAADHTHDDEACACLMCHGFYAATRDLARLEEMFRRAPRGLLALRTGHPSGVAVLDFEGTRDGEGEPTGVEVLERWEEWSGGWSLPKTRAARTEHGGVHLLVGVERTDYVTSRNRILPSVDVKGNGGYVVLPPAPGRAWLGEGPVARAPGELLAWLRTVRPKTRGGGAGGGTPGHAAGYDFERFAREGCPGGLRDEFLNDFIFRLRKRGVSRQDAVVLTREVWKRCAQPPDASYYMPWSDVEPKFDYVWRRVEPDQIPDAAARWVRSATRTASEPGAPRQTGAVTIVRPGRDR